MKTINVIKQFSLILILGFLSCNKTVPKSYEEIEEYKINLTKENLRTFFLGAINFCSDTDYGKYLDNPRSLDEYKNGGNCCTNSVPSPYINLSEYYVYAMEGDQSIFQNRDNPFKLKEIRKKWEGRVREAKNEAKKVNPKELKYKGFRSVSINTYDVNSKKIDFFGQWVSISFGGTQGDWHGKIDFRYKGGEAPIIKGLDLTSEEAESLFKYFEDNRRHPNIAPEKDLNTIITYSLEKPQHNGRLSQLEVEVKKVEFFYPNGWDKKIGEIIF